ncbi:hypothetical protein ACFY0A_15505 [Streptomyces sp. NPDC001698]|uniref:hypothetical protein n=1 Tax=unclassified Streptomyces TaxID=2593676 RepID=UPI00369CE3DA
MAGSIIAAIMIVHMPVKAGRSPAMVRDHPMSPQRSATHAQAAAAVSSTGPE